MRIVVDHEAVQREPRRGLDGDRAMPGLGDDRGGLGVAEDLADLERGEPVVDRHQHGAQPRRRQVAREERRAVEAQVRHAIAAAHAARRQHTGEPRAGLGQLGERDRAILVDHRHARRRVRDELLHRARRAEVDAARHAARHVAHRAPARGGAGKNPDATNQSR
jgi:hypothetical protein